MDTSRQRLLFSGGRRPRGRGVAAPRPSLEAVVEAYLELAREHVAIGADELDALLAARFGLDADDPLLDEVDGAVQDDDGPVTMLPPDVVVHAPALMAGAVLTHRLSAEEHAEDFLVLDTDLAGFLRVEQPVDGDEPLDIDEVDGRMCWVGPPGWLADRSPGALLAVAVDDDGGVSLAELDDPPTAPPGLVERLRAVYDTELEEPGLPVSAEDLLLGVRFRDRAAFAGPVPPLTELAGVAGLARRGDEFAHAESVWAAGAETDRLWRLADRLGTDGAATTALRALELLDGGDAAALRRALDLAQEPDVVVAVTEELLGVDEDPDRLAAFLALTDRLVAAAGRSPRAATARWMAAVAAERDGRVLDAESHLRAACSEAEGWPFVEDRLAWFEADRGDAAAALGRWRAIGVPDDDPDVQLAAPFAGRDTPEPGRNAPCWCGSGRKYKQCHLGRPVPAPLPQRVGWLWRKAVAYLERRGGAAEEALLGYATWRAGADDDLYAALADPLTVDVVLHEGGWFARFLDERGPLLPADEALLGASWLLVDRTVFEVLAVRPGTGMDLRDLRTGHQLAVTGRTASPAAPVGALLCARVVPDGSDTGHQFVGAVRPVPPGRERGLLALLDERDGAMLLGWAAARAAPSRVLDGAEPGSEPPDPAALAEIQDGHERRWCDEPVPALDGATPREAAADPTRRADVLHLISSFPEIDPASGAFGLRPWRLRELLDLG